MKEIVEKLKIEVSGRYREGFRMKIMKIWIKTIIYTQYVIIAHCFIMYYNTEVQIIATSSRKSCYFNIVCIESIAIFT